MKKSIKISILVFLLVIFNSCKNWVTNVDPLVDAISDSQLNAEDQLPLLINGVETKFASAFDWTNMLAAGLSDAFFYNPAPGYNLQCKDIDRGSIELDNTYTSETYSKIGQLRFYADDLVRRTNLMSVSDTTLRDSALFIGYFYGGYARYLYATYFGLSQTQGGSPINGGPFVNSDKMYKEAIDSFKQSLKYTNNALMIRTVNSIIARAYLYKGDYSNSATYAENGLVSGDSVFQALHNTTYGNDNSWYEMASKRNAIFVADLRFKHYIDIDPNEGSRIILFSTTVINEVQTDTGLVEDTTMGYVQSVYPGISSSQVVISWQENNLMRAELNLRGFGLGGASAMELVNEVRASHSIAPLNSVDLDSIYVERDKELFPSGNRLVDERRFNRWHLGSGTWEYLPIPESERDSNLHLH